MVKLSDRDISSIMKRVKEADAKPPDLIARLKATLFDKQLAVFLDGKHRRAVCCGRRAGKTQGITRSLLLACLTANKSIAVYFATTLASARKLVWDGPEGIPAIIQDLGLDAICEVNETDHRVKFSNGSVLWVSGCETLPDCRRWKGQRYDLAVLDECQDWPEEILQYMVHQALAPALMDRRGKLILTGTPGPLLDGLFYKVAEGQLPEWSTHHWTCFENPHIPKPQEFIDDECRSRGLTLEDPIIQREFFGRWVRDISSLLFHYQPGRNDYAALPAAQEWRYVVGMDVGVRDLSTFVVTAFRQYDPTVYVLEAHGMNGNDVTAFCEVAKSYRIKYPTCLYFMDQGGLGAGYALELRTRHGIVAYPAKKTDKAGYIRLCNDQYRLGFIKLGPATTALKDQLLRLQMDLRTQIEKPSQACDYCDAFLYAWRGCWAYLAKPEPDHSPDAMLQERVRQTLAQRGPRPDRELAAERAAMAFRPAYDAD